MNWPLVPQQFATGILNGGIIALIALGVVLIVKSSEVFNFAQGQLVMVGAYVTWWFAGASETGRELFNLPLWAAVIMAFIVMAGVGLLIERLALRPMTGQPLLSIILMTLGMAAFLDGLTALVFDVAPKSNFPAPYAPSDVIRVPFPGAFNDTIILKQTLVAAFVVSVLAMAIFMIFFRLTRTGLAMRATAENHELARSMGIKVPRVFGISWAVAGMVATLGGVLLASQVGVSLNLSTVVLIAFPAVLLGGLDSFPGAVVGGIIVGLVSALTQAASVVEVRNAAEIAPYVLLLFVLVLRPEGLFGQKRIERI